MFLSEQTNDHRHQLNCYKHYCQFVSVAPNCSLFMMIRLRVQYAVHFRCQDLLKRQRMVHFGSNSTPRIPLDKIDWATRRRNWELLNEILVSIPDVLEKGDWIIPKQESQRSNNYQYAVLLKHLTYNRTPVTFSPNRELVLKTLLDISHNRNDFSHSLGPLRLAYVCDSFGPTKATLVYVDTFANWMNSIDIRNQRRLMFGSLLSMHLEQDNRFAKLAAKSPTTIEDVNGINSTTLLSPFNNAVKANDSYSGKEKLLLPKWLHYIPVNELCLQVLMKLKAIHSSKLQDMNTSSLSLYWDFLTVMIDKNYSGANEFSNAVKQLGEMIITYGPFSNKAQCDIVFFFLNLDYVNLF